MKLFRAILPLFLGFVFIGCQDKPTEKTAQKPASTSIEIAPESSYKGMEEKILNHLTVDEIPADFPKYREGETQEEYRTRAFLWAKENLTLVKPEYHQKIENFRTK